METAVPSLKRLCMAFFARYVAQLPPDARFELEEQFKHYNDTLLGETLSLSDLFRPPFVGERIELDLSQKGFLRAGFDWRIIDEVGQKQEVREHIERYFVMQNSANYCAVSLIADVVSVEPETRTWTLRGVSARAKRVANTGQVGLGYFGPVFVQLPEEAEVVLLQNADNPSKSGIDYKYVCDHIECDWCRRGAHPAEVKVDYERDECDGCPLLPYHVAQRWTDGRVDEFPYGE